MSYFSDRYKKLKEQGLCVVCGVAPANGKARCEWCAKRVAASSKRRYKISKRKVYASLAANDLQKQGVHVVKNVQRKF